MFRRITKMLIAAVIGAGAMAGSVAANEVNVYSYRQPELVQPLLDRFTDSTGIRVNLLSISKGLVARVREEGSLSPADVILTVDIGRLSNAVAQGITQPIRDATVEANVPADLRDPAGDWVGLTTRARIVYASRERVTPGAITTYEDLADPRWKGRICTRSGRHQYNVALLAAVIRHHGEAAAERWLRGVKANLARRPQGNDRAQVKAIWAGQCDISIGNTYYMGKMLSDPEQVAWANSVRVAFPVFEDGGTHVNISGAAMARHAPNPENAMALIRFLTSDEAQKIYAGTNHEYPANPALEASELVRSWGSFTADPVALSEIATLRARALQIVDRVGFDD